MKRNIGWILTVVFALTLGAGVGWQVGFNRTTQVFLSDALTFDALAVRRYVDVLEQMRAQDHERAMELLESWLDDVLIVVMEPATYDYPLEQGVVEKVDSAYFEAKAYREAFPRSSARAMIDRMIMTIWEAGPPNGSR